VGGMTSFILASLFFAVLSWYLSGSRSAIYLFYFIAYVPFLTMDAGAGGMTGLDSLGSNNALFKLSIRVFSTAGMMLLLIRRREAMRVVFSKHSLPVLGFFVWACLGITQSQTPAVSIIRLGELLVFFLFGVTIFLEKSRGAGPREVARWHCLALMPLLLMALWSVVNRPDLAMHVNTLGQGRLGHKMLNANVLAFAAVILTLWGTHEMREVGRSERFFSRERLLPLAVLVLAVGVVFMTRSRTALVTLVAGQCVLWLPVSRGNSRRRLVAMAMIAGGLMLATLQLDQIIAWVLRDGSSADLMNGTGRTGLWAALLTQQVPQSPILGAGYLMLSDMGTFPHEGANWTNSHNTYLFALVATGLPGCIAICTIAVLPIRAAFLRYMRSDAEERSSWTLILACQTVVFISGVTGFGISGYPNAVMLFHYAMYTWTLSMNSAPRRVSRLRAVPLRAIPGGA
jgi:hypothetical protein